MLHHLPDTMVAPVLTLVLWSMFMLAWLYATRIPAMRKARVKLDPTVPRSALTEALPPRVRWKADNYNHLMEQPTLFYAVALSLAVLDAGDGLNLQLAWLYVALRVAHSLVQALINLIVLRWALFVASSAVLFALAVRAASLVF